LQKVSPKYTQRVNLCPIPLKKIKLKVKNQEEIIVRKLSEVHLQIRLYPSIPPTAQLNLLRQFL
jgi:hypothetical protein